MKAAAPFLGPRTLWLLGILAALLLLALFGSVTGSVGFPDLRPAIAAAGVWGPVLFILFRALTYILAPLSAAPVLAAAPLLFGFWGAVLYTLAGDLLGASANFWISRLGGRRLLAHIAGPGILPRIDSLSDRGLDWQILLLIRLVGASFYDVAAYAAGLTRLRFALFLLITLAAGVPGNVLLIWLARKTLDFGGLAALLGFAFVLALAGVFLTGGLFHRRRSAPPPAD